MPEGPKVDISDTKGIARGSSYVSRYAGGWVVPAPAILRTRSRTQCGSYIGVLPGGGLSHSASLDGVMVSTQDYGCFVNLTEILYGVLSWVSLESL